MIVNTKAEVGDKIYYVRNRKIGFGPIDMLSIDVREDNTEIRYSVEGTDFWIEHEDVYALESKALESLKKNKELNDGV